MTVYNINLGIGWASSGVEYAQKYRDQSFNEVGIKRKFIFSDLILGNNIGDLTANLGFDNDNIIWLYNFFTDVKISTSNYSLDTLENELNLKKLSSNVKTVGKEVFYQLNDGLQLVARLSDAEKRTIDQVSYVKNNTLLKRDFYSYTKYACEYYLGADKDNRVTFREFYNEDGTIAYTQHLNGDQETFEFANGEQLALELNFHLRELRCRITIKNKQVHYGKNLYT